MHYKTCNRSPVVVESFHLHVYRAQGDVGGVHSLEGDARFSALKVDISHKFSDRFNYLLQEGAVQ